MRRARSAFSAVLALLAFGALVGSAGAEVAAVVTPGTVPVPQPAPSPLLSSWAHPESPGPIYLDPDVRSPRVARIHLYTADGFPEVYPVLGTTIDQDGSEWSKVRIPGRPNGRTGWVLQELLGPLHQTGWRIFVSRRARRMRVYYEGRLLRVFPVGVGKPSTPTPAGHFWIDERFKIGDPSSPYWPYALGTSDYSTLPNWPGEGVVGIHGPFGEPQKIPGDPSHGCIRMLAKDIEWLGRRVSLGTPVEVT